MTESSGYTPEPLRGGPDFTFYRGRQHGTLSPVLAVALAAEQPAPDLRRLKHEYSLVAEVVPAWSAGPLARTRHKGRTILVLKNPGGEPLDRVLDRGHGQPLDLTRVPRIVIVWRPHFAQVHRRVLVPRIRTILKLSFALLW